MGNTSAKDSAKDTNTNNDKSTKNTNTSKNYESNDLNLLPAILFTENTYITDWFFKKYNKTIYFQAKNKLLHEALEKKRATQDPFVNKDTIELADSESTEILLRHTRRPFYVYGVTLGQVRTMKKSTT